MPYTFGASQADDVNQSIANNSFTNNNVSCLVCGWWYPTNVAGTDVLFSMGNTSCVQIASTTQINLTSQNATTNGVWQGTFPTLNNNTWYFFAFLTNCTNTGPAGDIRMWQGTIDTAPVEVSVTQLTAPAGNFTASAAFTIGNKGTSATDAFDGDIANVAILHDASGAATTPLAPATYGTWAQSEVDLIGRVYVRPLWLGDYAQLLECGQRSNAASFVRLLFDLNNGYSDGIGRVGNASNPFLTLVVNGATPSVTTRNPRPPISRPGWPLRRR